jgi:hypothetical protein
MGIEENQEREKQSKSRRSGLHSSAEAAGNREITHFFQAKQPPA